MYIIIGHEGVVINIDDHMGPVVMRVQAVNGLSMDGPALETSFRWGEVPLLDRLHVVATQIVAGARPQVVPDATSKPGLDNTHAV